jgi:hypothetical protein
MLMPSDARAPLPSFPLRFRAIGSGASKLVWPGLAVTAQAASHLQDRAEQTDTTPPADKLASATPLSRPKNLPPRRSLNVRQGLSGAGLSTSGTGLRMAGL